MNNKATWNGYAVQGDVKELEQITGSKGFVNLDKDDIIAMLSADGENYVVTANAGKIEDAFNAALANIPVIILCHRKN